MVAVETDQEVVELLKTLTAMSGNTTAKVTIEALESVMNQRQRPNLLPAIDLIRCQVDCLEDEVRRAVYNDTEVLRMKWDQYLRSRTSGASSIAGFLSNLALGTTQATQENGVALLTVHSAKGLEFDVVFIMGMAEGVFPDYRARNNQRNAAEERRNVFVAVTRSKRLLYLSYPRTRMMSRGETWTAQPSSFLQDLSLV